MFVRSFCLLAFVGSIVINAYPAPEDIVPDDFTDFFVVSEDLTAAANDQELSKKEEAPITEDYDTQDVTVLPIEEDQESSTDESETQEAKVDESDTGEILVETMSNQNDTVSDSEQGEESDGEESNDHNEESDSKNEEDSNSDEGSDESSNDSGESNADESSDESHTNEPNDHDSSISDVFIEGHQLRVVSQENPYEKIVCQMILGNNEEIFDKKCISLRPSILLPSLQEYVVVLNQKLIYGEKYICQAITNPIEGVLQQLCVTHDGWIFDPVNQQENLIFV